MKLPYFLLLMGLAGCAAFGAGGNIAPAAPVVQTAQSHHPAGVSLHLLSYNTFGLPGPIGKDLAKRFAAIPAAIGGLDIVCLQETFAHESKRILESEVYPYAYRQSQATMFNPLGSGLTILSRYRLQSVRFRPFKKCADTDCFSRKGVLFARVDIPKLGLVDIYDTHYQSDAAYTRERLGDNADLVAFLRENAEGNPTFLLGDFNFLEDEDEYGDLAEKLAPLDLFRQLHPEDPGYTLDPANPVGINRESARLDYVFYLSNPKFDLDILKAEVALRNEPLSDHYGVRVKVRLRPKS